MKKEIIKEIIRDFHREPLPETLPRDLEVPLNSSKIVTLVGVRRSGKSYLLFELMKQLISRQSIPKERILYLNFEDERLGLTQDELENILQGYAELYPNLKLSECYLFFDEIQNISGWEKFVRRIYDTVTRNIFVSGSNSKLLSREIATSLRGRTLSYEVFPLSFEEYIRFHGVDRDIYHSKTRAKIVHYFEKFLLEGGFPELVNFNEKSMKNRILQEYFNVMLYRDLIERFQFKNVTILKYFMKRALENITSPFSINKIYNELKSQGYKIGKNTLYEYVDAAETAFLILSAKKYAPSILKQELSAKKMYVIDNGILNAITFKFSKNSGKLLENLVFMELYKKGKNIYYYKNRKECDFMVVDEGGVKMAIQVSYTISEHETLKRELDGLKLAAASAGLNSGYVLTMNDEKRIEKDGFTVNVMSAYKFFLEN